MFGLAQGGQRVPRSIGTVAKHRETRLFTSEEFDSGRTIGSIGWSECGGGHQPSLGFDGNGAL